MTTTIPAHRMAAWLALGTTLILVWSALGVGILGADGDRANLMYAGVVAAGLIGAVAARLQPPGMARTMVAMAGVQAVVTVVALLAGVHRSGVSPVAEILGLNGFFIALFLVSAWLYRRG